MKKKIVILTDYNGFFGSKYNAEPYLSGFDLKLLSDIFSSFSYEVSYMKLHEVINVSPELWREKIVLYTSSEDTSYKYKQFIEDIVLYLSICGARLLPNYYHLRANNNKVFMELFGKKIAGKDIYTLKSGIHGCYEDILSQIDKIELPVVIKMSEGAQSRGVFLAKTINELKKYSKKVSRSSNIVRELWEIGRSIKYNNYSRESKYRNKFVTQQFIQNLKSDYKILVYGDIYYILERAIRENDFRASGSKFNYKFGSHVNLPKGILDFAERYTKILDLPNVSLDIGFDGINFFVFEFQSIYFGSSTHLKSDGFYTKEDGKWLFKDTIYTLEYVFSYSVDQYLTKTSS